MTTVDEQKVLRKAYDRCLVLKELLRHQTLGDKLATQAEQLTDAIHHYIVKKTEYSSVAIGAAKEVWGLACQGELVSEEQIGEIIDRHQDYCKHPGNEIVKI